MDFTNHYQIRVTTEEDVFALFDKQGKESLRKKIEDEREQWRRDEETKKGNARIKAEIDRIKMTTPKKTLQAFLNLQNVLMTHQDDMPEEVYDTINDLLASADNNTNLFSCMTEMMAVCDYEETEIVKEKKWTTHRDKTMGQKLTEAQKIIRANDPDDKHWTMCALCKRCMTVDWYIKNHKNTHTCRRATEAQALALKEKKIFALEMGKDLAKLQVQNPQEINASLGEIETGLGDLKIGNIL
jgi:hypothetical protein